MMRGLENCYKYAFDGVGKYGVPPLEPLRELPDGEFIPINYAKTAKGKEGKICHCFTDDYQFLRYWNYPDSAVEMLQKFRAVCAPDFSIYTDMPLAMQIYNHYRKHWLAAYWQLYGMTVIPTISWADESSFDWCFDGEPEGSIVAVSSVGTQQSRDSKRLFLAGYQEMMDRLYPVCVVFYGKIPDGCGGNIVQISPHYQEIAARRAAAHGDQVPL